MATTGKIAEVLFENVLDSYEHQGQLLDLCNFESPDPSDMQNASNVIWRPAQQHAPIIDGWDMTDEETSIIEETYPAILGSPKNDFVEQRADDLRDMRFWERRGKQSGRRQATELNKQIASVVALQGSMFYRSSVASGYDFIAEEQALLNERQTADDTRCFVLNDRDTLKFSKELASRENLAGRPEGAWKTGQIGSDVAEFDLFTGSYLPNLAGGASPATTCTGDQTFEPEAGSVNTATGVVTNVDCRIANVVVADSDDYNVGDKVTIGAIKSLALADKNATNQLMTFTVVGKPDSTHMQIYPKPIAADDADLSTLEAAYANVDTTIADEDVVARLNLDASAKVNLFWCKEAVEVLGGTIPANLFAQYDGMKVITQQMSNGQTLYMVYDGDIATLTFRYRIFTFYGITMANPGAAGVGITFSA